MRDWKKKPKKSVSYAERRRKAKKCEYVKKEKIKENCEPFLTFGTINLLSPQSSLRPEEQYTYIWI